MLELAPEQTIKALEARAATYKQPPLTLPQVMDHLKHPQRLPKFAEEGCRYIARRGW